MNTISTHEMLHFYLVTLTRNGSKCSVVGEGWGPGPVLPLLL